MSREIRRVPMGWEHPHVWADQWDSRLGLVVGKSALGLATTEELFRPERGSR